jgi:hypothetical protein
VEYIILQDNNIEWLEEDVNKFIKDGWTPQGGVALTTVESDGEIFYTAAQAMVKEEGGA